MTASFTYDISFPINYNSKQQYPVIFAMHGMGSNEKDMAAMLSGLSKEFIMISIRGHLTQGNGYAFFKIKSIGNPEREIFDQSVNRLKEFITYATKKYAIDPKRRYLLGFSQGAIMSMTLALVMGEEIKGIVALSGYIPWFVQEEYEKKTVQHMSIFISHGEYDPVFPVETGEKNRQYFSEQSNHVTYKTYPTNHSVTLENVQDFTKWLLHDAKSSNSN